MRITVLGSGGWGTALALLLLENGNDVTLWSHTRAHCDRLRQTRENPRLPGVALPEGLKLTADMEEAAGSALVVMAAPSFAVKETARLAAPFLSRDAVVVSAAKGIERDTALSMTRFTTRGLWTILRWKWLFNL